MAPRVCRASGRRKEGVPMSSRAFRPNPKLQTKFQLQIVSVFVVFVLPFVFLAFIPGAGWAYVGWFALANAIWMGIAFALVPRYYRSISYELTDEEVRVHKGIITQTVQTVPYRTVTNVELKRGPFSRRLGLGDVHVQTAGYSQQAAAEATLSGLADYEEVSQQVIESLRRYRSRAGAAVTVDESPLAGGASAGAEQTLSAILAEVRALRESLARQ